ncbi:winged helix DNA-binding protein [Parvibaculum sp.]|uniref:winged helix DNA-binding protein n=1 Tax=Parvibaculum sp. TaxID=2024848 RepID=UPI00320E94FE
MSMQAFTDRQTWATRPVPQEGPLTRGRARMLLDLYNARMKFFPTGLFADPAWDMLLDLTHARLAGKRISVSSLCIAANVPATTALRRIGDLVGSGLAVRVKDETDGRRVFVELTDDGFTRMGRYLESVLKAMSADTSLPLK